MKIFECVIALGLSCHLSGMSLLDNQFRFKEGCSTIDAIDRELSDSITFEERGVVLVVFLVLVNACKSLFWSMIKGVLIFHQMSPFPCMQYDENC